MSYMFRRNLGAKICRRHWVRAFVIHLLGDQKIDTIEECRRYAGQSTLARSQYFQRHVPRFRAPRSRPLWKLTPRQRVKANRGNSMPDRSHKVGFVVEPLQTRRTCDDRGCCRKSRQVIGRSASLIGSRDAKRLQSRLVLWRARLDGKRMNFACHFFGQ